MEDKDQVDGTLVSMKIAKSAPQTIQGIFEKFASEKDDYGFTKTHVVIELARYEGENLMSRSQAKRILMRVEKFKEVLLDFKGVESIGEAFADEMFRVHPLEHPNVLLPPSNTQSSGMKNIQPDKNPRGIPQK